MEQLRTNDLVITIKDVFNQIDNYTLPAFSLGTVLCHFPSSSLVIAEFAEVGIRTLTRTDIVKI